MIGQNSLLHEISQGYAIQAERAELIYNGINKIFRISNSTKHFILKIFRKNEHTKYQISFERNMMTHLLINKLDCIEPIFPESHEEQIYVFDNQTYYGILSYEHNGTTYTANSAHELLFGRALLKLHNCPAPPFINPKKSSTSPNQIIKKLRKIRDYPQANLLKKIIIKLFEDIEKTSTPHTQHFKRHICHGDAWPGNALYSKNHCTLIDFEHTNISDPAFDIATFMWWLTGVEDKEEQKLTIWNNFTSGYGGTIESYINKYTPTLIKTNQLRNLVFLHNNIVISEEILELAHQQTSELIIRLIPYTDLEKLVDSLWKN